MIDPLLILFLIVLYVGVLFVVARAVERGVSWAQRLSRSPAVYALALAVYCTTWTFYGSVGSAASSGLLFATTYLGPTLMALTWWFVLRKLVRIKNTYRITSIADFVSARYDKSELLAVLVTVLVLVGTTPYVALQLKAVTDTMTLILAGAGSNWISSNADLLTVVLMVAFTILFGVRRLDPTERHPGVMTALAVLSGVKLLAFLLVGGFVVFGLYNGTEDLFRQLSASPFRGLATQAGVTSSDYLVWGTRLLLAMSAIQFLPRQFHVAVVENADERHVRTAMWALPLYLLLISLFTFPIAGAGLLQGLPVSEADTFVLRLPLLHGQSALALLAFIGGLSAAMGMIIVSAMTSATMITNHIVLPVVARSRRLGGLRRNLLQIRWVAVGGVLLAGYAFARLIGESYTLVSMGILSFAAVLQLAPAILGGLFWRQGTRRGAVLGVGAGFLIWLYTLFLPSFARSGWLPLSWLTHGPLGISFLSPERLFGLSGLDPLVHSVFWSLLFNVGFYVWGSLYFAESAQGRRLATEFVDVLVAGAATVATISTEEATTVLEEKRLAAEQLLSQYLSSAEAQRVVQNSLDAAGIAGRTLVKVAELADFYHELERSLAGLIGTSAAHQAIVQAELFTEAESQALSDVYADILASLRVSPEELRQRIDYYRERDEMLARQAESLEARVRERTRAQEAAAEVSRAVTSILEPERLIQEVVDLIREQFDLYYVGLFLLDESEEWAVLQAGTGEAGRAMLAREHRIKVGEGMVGWSVVNAQARVALEAGEDAVRLATAELPETRSEAAVPLRSRGRVIGALTVQDDEPGAFDPGTLTVLQTMADQVAVAIDNARLFSASQEALESERRAYGQMTRQAWAALLRARTALGYVYDRSNVQTVEGEWDTEMQMARATGQSVLGASDEQPSLAVPIVARNQVIGAVRFTKGEPGAVWSDDEVLLLETLTQQLGQALESAQLYQQTRRRAARERAAREITNEIRRPIELEAILRAAVSSLGEHLGVPQTYVRLTLDEDRAGNGGEHHGDEEL